MTVNKEKLEKELTQLVKMFASKHGLDYIEVSATPSAIAVRINKK